MKLHLTGDVEDEEESAMASAEDQKEGEFQVRANMITVTPPTQCCVFMQVFWAYIVGMLTSLGKMKLDRIHSMLKMFAVQGTGAKEFTQVGAKGHLKQHHNSSYDNAIITHSNIIRMLLTTLCH